MTGSMVLWAGVFGGLTVGVVRAGRRTWRADHDRLVAALYVGLALFCLCGAIGALLR